MRDLALGGADCHDGNALSAMTKHADLDRSMLQVWPPFFPFLGITASNPCKDTQLRHCCATVAPLFAGWILGRAIQWNPFNRKRTNST